MKRHFDTPQKTDQSNDGTLSFCVTMCETLLAK